MKKLPLILCASVALFCSAAAAVVSPLLLPVASQFEDFETEAVIIEALSYHHDGGRDDREDATRPRKGKQLSHLSPFFTDSFLILPGIPAKNENVMGNASSPVSTIDSTCITNQGVKGNCESFEACFPLLNLPEDKFGNGTTNYNNLNEEVYQLSVERKCASVVHAGRSKFSNVCCGHLPPQNDSGTQTPQLYSADVSHDDFVFESTSSKYTKVVNSWATCGEKQFNTRIIGGEEAFYHEYPWMVSLWGKSGKHICGAALLDNNFVLTAAHCVARYTSEDVGKIRLLIGDHNIHSTSDGHHEERSVSRIIRHKRFSFVTFVHDIALLKLDRPVPYTDRIRPICLPTGTKAVDTDPELVVAGWGQTLYQGKSSSVLRKVTVPGVKVDDCRHVYSQISPLGITNEMLCAGGNGVDSCIGDSGGPLIQLVNNRFEQAGIVSFGRECGSYPGVYTKVHSYLNWISVNRNKY